MSSLVNFVLGCKTALSAGSFSGQLSYYSGELKFSELIDS